MPLILPSAISTFGFNPRQDLLALNLTFAAWLGHHEPVTALGLPPGFPEPEVLVTPPRWMPLAHAGESVIFA